MSEFALLGAEVVAVTVLVLGLYFPRHRRRDLMVAFFGVNIGVLAVADALRSSNAGTGLGLGFALFGVLSIIQLRSTELLDAKVHSARPLRVDLINDSTLVDVRYADLSRKSIAPLSPAAYPVHS
jgi:Domain of unknown function (DUF4956)